MIRKDQVKYMRPLVAEKALNLAHHYLYYKMGDTFKITSTLVKRTYVEIINDEPTPLISKQFIESEDFTPQMFREPIALLNASTSPIVIKSSTSNETKTIQISQYLILVNVKRFLKELPVLNNTYDPDDEREDHEVCNINLENLIAAYINHMSSVMRVIYNETHTDSLVNSDYEIFKDCDMCDLVSTLAANIENQLNSSPYGLQNLSSASQKMLASTYKNRYLDLYRAITEPDNRYIPKHFLEITDRTAWVFINVIKDTLNFIMYPLIEKIFGKQSEDFEFKDLGFDLIDYTFGLSDDIFTTEIYTCGNYSNPKYGNVLKLSSHVTGEELELIHFDLRYFIDTCITKCNGDLESIMRQVVITLTTSLFYIYDAKHPDEKRYTYDDLEELKFADENEEGSMAKKVVMTSLNSGFIDKDNAEMVDVYIKQAMLMAEINCTDKDIKSQDIQKFNSSEYQGESIVKYGLNMAFINSMVEKWLIHMSQMPNYYPGLTMAKKYEYSSVKSLVDYYEDK